MAENCFLESIIGVEEATILWSTLPKEPAMKALKSEQERNPSMTNHQTRHSVGYDGTDPEITRNI
jgi:hypothetical protein